MRLKVICLTLMLVLVPLARVVQARPQSTDDQKTAKAKSEIAKRVANKKTKVKLKLRTGEQVKARIDQAGDSTFTVTEDKTGRQLQLPYSDVDEVKGRGGLGTGAKIGIVAAIVVVVVAVVAVISIKNFDPFKGGITVR